MHPVSVLSVVSIPVKLINSLSIYTVPPSVGKSLTSSSVIEVSLRPTAFFNLPKAPSLTTS